MMERVEAALRTAAHAAELIAERTARVDPGWLLAGIFLYLVSQAVRTRGWHTILRAAYPDATGLRRRDVMRAYLAGAGINALVPGRGGDLVKLALVRRRVPESSYAPLAATFVPETLFETFCGTLLVAWALGNGFLPIPAGHGDLPELDVSLIVRHPIASALVATVMAAGGWWLARRFGPRLRRGLAILATPRLFLTGVASWQALARLIRLGSLAALMAAFALPVTPATVLLVMAAQGGGRLLPLAPASAGLRLAMLSYGFVEVTGQAVDIAAVTAFAVGVGAILGAASLAVAVVVLAQEFGTRSPARAVAAARAALGARSPAPAPGPAAPPAPERAG
jgi:uncharacterized membrane protein YbhN (UPF0104 family)